MFRGIEMILQGRDPREAWIWAQRICGVCTMVHAIASVRAVEDALKIDVPENARIVRNLIAGAQMVQDHVIHFYHLHALDWVDVASALKADPAKTSQIAQSISNCEKSSATYFKGVQQRVKGVVDSGQLSLFASGYWGHPAYTLPPEVNLLAVAHYLEALVLAEGFHPHPRGAGRQESASAVVPGGRHDHRDGSERAGAVINPDTIELHARSGAGALKFVEDYYIPDVLAIAPLYKDWFTRGEGSWQFPLLRRLFVGRSERSEDVPVSARHRDGPRHHEGLPGGSVEDHRIRRASWYEYSGGAKRPPSFRGRDQPEIQPARNLLTIIWTSTPNTPG
jgi:Ni,Fe-hydrogenase I large subunit